MNVRPIGKIFSSVPMVLAMYLAMMSLQPVRAGLIDPDCTVEKAAKSAASKAAIGIGGRCSPAEAAKDTAKRATGIEGKGKVEKLVPSVDKQDIKPTIKKPW